MSATAPPPPLRGGEGKGRGSGEGWCVHLHEDVGAASSRGAGVEGQQTGKLNKPDTENKPIGKTGHGYERKKRVSSALI